MTNMTIMVSGPVMGPDKSTKLERDIHLACNEVRKRQKLNRLQVMISFTSGPSRDGKDVHILIIDPPGRALPLPGPTYGPVPEDFASTIGEVVSRRFKGSRVWCTPFPPTGANGAFCTWTNEKRRAQPWPKGVPEPIRDT